MSPGHTSRRTYGIALADSFVPTPELIEAAAAVKAELAAAVAAEAVAAEVGIVADEVVAEADAPIAVEAATADSVVSEASLADLLVDGVDYELLGHAILGVVFKNLAASDEVVELRQVRADLEAARAALAEAKAVVAQLGMDLSREQAQRKQVEETAKVLSLEVEALQAELTDMKNGSLIDTARTTTWIPLNTAHEKHIKELNKIVRAVPSVRG